MTIVLPKDYHCKSALEKSRILCIDNDQALKEDIRALRIDFKHNAQLNHEFSLHPLGRHMQITSLDKAPTHQHKQ